MYDLAMRLERIGREGRTAGRADLMIELESAVARARADPRSAAERCRDTKIQARPFVVCLEYTRAMRLSLKRLKPAGSVDLLTNALLIGGVALIVGSVAAATILIPPSPPVGSGEADPNPAVPEPTSVGRPSVALSADQVATVLSVDASAGAGIAARAGDRIDVFGYFARQLIGSESVTRVLLQDVPVLKVDRSGPGVVLSLAVPHDGALLLQEAQAIGARPFVTLRAAVGTPSFGATPRSFSDTDLADRLVGVR